MINTICLYIGLGSILGLNEQDQLPLYVVRLSSENE